MTERKHHNHSIRPKDDDTKISEEKSEEIEVEAKVEKET